MSSEDTTPEGFETKPEKRASGGSGGSGGSGFNIGTQSAGSIQNVDGDLTIGELKVEATWNTADLRRELAQLGEEIRGVPLPAATRKAVNALLAAAEAEAGKTLPDRARIAQLVTKAALTLEDAGELLTAGTSLVEAFRRIATVLGPEGKPLLTLLPLK
jgi:hypothetical protein